MVLRRVGSCGEQLLAASWALGRMARGELTHSLTKIYNIKIVAIILLTNLKLG